jgi:hypothetical protein
MGAEENDRAQINEPGYVKTAILKRRRSDHTGVSGTRSPWRGNKINSCEESLSYSKPMPGRKRNVACDLFGLISLGRNALIASDARGPRTCRQRRQQATSQFSGQTSSNTLNMGDLCLNEVTRIKSCSSLLAQICSLGQ